MSQQFKHGIAIALSCFALAACHDDSDSLGPVNDAELLVLIAQSNQARNDFPGLYTDNLFFNRLTQTGVVRFDTTAQIPLYYVSVGGNTEPAAITKAIDNIEARLGDIFTDFTYIDADLSVYRDASRPTENVGNRTYDAATFKAAHGITGGLVFAQGTGYYNTDYSSDPQNMCANASTGPYNGGMNIEVDPNTQSYATDALLWVNMGNGQCHWDTQTAMHEMAHAMGMFNHLDGYFGHWSVTAMDILDTMYSNNSGTPYQSLLPARD